MSPPIDLQCTPGLENVQEEPRHLRCWKYLPFRRVLDRTSFEIRLDDIFINYSRVVFALQDWETDVYRVPKEQSRETSSYDYGYAKPFENYCCLFTA